MEFKPDILAEKLEECYKDDGFRLLWKVIENEAAGAERAYLSMPVDHPNFVQNAAYRKGLMDGMKTIVALKPMVPSMLKQNSISWEDVYGQEKDDDQG